MMDARGKQGPIPCQYTSCRVQCSGELQRGYMVALVFNVTNLRTHIPFHLKAKAMAMAMQEKQSLGQGLFVFLCCCCLARSEGPRG